MLNSELLGTFLEVVRRGGVTGASRALHLSQPAISRQIKQLEAHFELALFERTGRGLTPTAAGQRLFERARPLLLELEGLGDELEVGPIRGRVSLGVSPSWGAMFSAGLIELIRRTLPEVELRVVSILSGALGGAVARGALDLGLLYAPTDEAGLVTADLWQESSYLIVSTAARIHGRPAPSVGSISLKRALALGLVLPSSRYGLRGLLERAAQRHGMSLSVEVEVDSVQLALALVRRNVGAMFLTERALPDLDRKAFACIPLRGGGLRRSAQLVSVHSAMRRQAVRAVWEICETAARRRVVHEGERAEPRAR